MLAAKATTSPHSNPTDCQNPKRCVSSLLTSHTQPSFRAMCVGFRCTLIVALERIMWIGSDRVWSWLWIQLPMEAKRLQLMRWVLECL